jgi:hypothetical protein
MYKSRVGPGGTILKSLTFDLGKDFKRQNRASGS